MARTLALCSTSSLPGGRWDAHRFRHFIDLLPPDVKHVIEFREPSWYEPRIQTLMKRRGVALCLHDMAGSATERRSEGPFIYVRFHGASSRYGGSYGEDRLERWAVWLNEQRARGCDVYAYFNNDVGGHAPRNALTLRRLLDTN